MIDENDLYDISAAFTRIRYDITYDLNVDVVDKIVQVLISNEELSYENRIRIALSSIDNLSKEQWYFAYHNNLYVHHVLLKNPYIYDILVKACLVLKYALVEKSYDKAYDLVDAIHCLPDIIAENKFTITKSYWKTHIRYYRNKWDKEFLLCEQKLYMKQSNLNYRIRMMMRRIYETK